MSGFLNTTCGLVDFVSAVNDERDDARYFDGRAPRKHREWHQDIAESGYKFVLKQAQRITSLVLPAKSYLLKYNSQKNALRKTLASHVMPGDLIGVPVVEPHYSYDITMPCDEMVQIARDHGIKHPRFCYDLPLFDMKKAFLLGVFAKADLKISEDGYANALCRSIVHDEWERYGETIAKLAYECFDTIVEDITDDNRPYLHMEGGWLPLWLCVIQQSCGNDIQAIIEYAKNRDPFLDAAFFYGLFVGNFHFYNDVSGDLTEARFHSAEEDVIGALSDFVSSLGVPFGVSKKRETIAFIISNRALLRKIVEVEDLNGAVKVLTNELDEILNQSRKFASKVVLREGRRYHLAIVSSRSEYDERIPYAEPIDGGGIIVEGYSVLGGYALADFSTEPVKAIEHGSRRPTRPKSINGTVLLDEAQIEKAFAPSNTELAPALADTKTLGYTPDGFALEFTNFESGMRAVSYDNMQQGIASVSLIGDVQPKIPMKDILVRCKGHLLVSGNASVLARKTLCAHVDGQSQYVDALPDLEDFEWIKASDLAKGDWVLSPALRLEEHPVNEKYDLADYIEDSDLADGRYEVLPDEILWHCQHTMKSDAYRYLRPGDVAENTGIPSLMISKNLNGTTSNEALTGVISRYLADFGYDYDRWVEEFCTIETISLPRYIAFDETMCYLLGFYIADGSVHEGCVQYALNRYSPEEIERLQAALDMIIPAVPLHYSTMLLDRNNRIGKGVVASLSCPPLAGLFKALVPWTVRDKQIPHRFMSMPLPYRQALLCGLFDGDGSLKNRCVYTTVSLTLARQVKLLMSEQNIMMSMTDTNSVASNGTVCHGYQLQAPYTDNVKALFDSIYDFSYARANKEDEQYVVSDGWFASRIYSIDDCVSDGMCIETENNSPIVTDTAVIKFTDDGSGKPHLPELRDGFALASREPRLIGADVEFVCDDYRIVPASQLKSGDRILGDEGVVEVLETTAHKDMPAIKTIVTGCEPAMVSDTVSVVLQNGVERQITDIFTGETLKTSIRRSYDDLETGDIVIDLADIVIDLPGVVIATDEITVQKRRRGEHGSFSLKKTYPRYWTVSSELASIIGVFATGGSCAANSVSITFGYDDETRAEWLEHVMQCVFDEKPTLVHRSDGVGMLTWNSGFVSKVLLALARDSEINGRICQIIAANRELAEAFARGCLWKYLREDHQIVPSTSRVMTAFRSGNCEMLYRWLLVTSGRAIRHNDKSVVFLIGDDQVGTPMDSILLPSHYSATSRMKSRSAQETLCDMVEIAFKDDLTRHVLTTSGMLCL